MPGEASPDRRGNLVMASRVVSLGLALGGPALGGCAGAAPTRFTAEAPMSKVEASTSVCQFEESHALEAQPDGSWLVPARSRLVAYDGRLDCAAPGGPMLGFVGARVTLRFVGTGLDLLLKDFGGGTAQTTNYFDVSIDDAPPRLLRVSPAQERYELASGLAEGEHTVELFKRVESAPGGVVGAGRAQILGFVLRGSKLLSVTRPERRLEFVGDSITCGYGNELESTDPSSEHYTSRRSNGHRAFGAVTAALLDARYSAVAYSGRGISRNYSDLPGTRVPELYLASVPDEPTATPWRPAQYVPHAVVINVGTNDFSTPGVDRAAFVGRYTELLAKLRGHHPAALLVATLGPLLSDDDASGAHVWSDARADVLASVEARRRAGDDLVRVVFFEPQSGPWGEDWHPTAATHAKMAQQLAPLLKGWLGW